MRAESVFGGEGGGFRDHEPRLAIRSFNQLPGLSPSLPQNVVPSRRLPFNLTLCKVCGLCMFYTTHQDTRYIVNPNGGRGQRKSAPGTRSAHRRRHSGVPRHRSTGGMTICSMSRLPSAPVHFPPHGPVPARPAPLPRVEPGSPRPLPPLSTVG